MSVLLFLPSDSTSPTYCLLESAFALAMPGKSFEDVTTLPSFICFSFFLFIIHLVFFLPLSFCYTRFWPRSLTYTVIPWDVCFLLNLLNITCSWDGGKKGFYTHGSLWREIWQPVWLAQFSSLWMCLENSLWQGLATCQVAVGTRQQKLAETSSASFLAEETYHGILPQGRSVSSLNLNLS